MFKINAIIAATFGFVNLGISCADRQDPESKRARLSDKNQTKCNVTIKQQTKSLKIFLTKTYVCDSMTSEQNKKEYKQTFSNQTKSIPPIVGKRGIYYGNNLLFFTYKKLIW